MHEVKLAMLEVAYSTVNEPRRSSRGTTGKIIALYERDAEAAHRRIASDSATRDTPANDQQVEPLAGK
jgi:hypothetical protein